MSDPTDSLPPTKGTTPLEEQCPFGAGDVLSQRYAIEQCIGEGTFGWVLSAIDLSGTPPQHVALKVLRSRYANHDEVVRRFDRRELALLLRVQALSPTPHVVRALAPTVLHHGGHPYLVLEFIDGPSLHEVLDGKALGLADARRFGTGIARGLAAIHSAGGVHRDLKPANVRLRHGSEPVVVDLGINRALWETQELTETGAGLMTPRYASPEQSTRGEVGPESDIYSLGLILYEMLTGIVPVAGEDLKATLTNRFESGQTVPSALIDCVLRCLNREPRRRPSALDVAAAFSAPQALAPKASGPWRGLLVGVTLLLVLVAGILFQHSRPASAPPLTPPTKDEIQDNGAAWIQQFDFPGALSELHLAPDSKGNLFVTGAFKGTLELGTGPLRSTGSADAFVARLDARGRTLWVRQLEATARRAPEGIAIGSKGQVFVMGHLEEKVGSDKDLFLVGFDPDGKRLWSRSVGGPGEQVATALVVDHQDNLTLLGSFSSRLNLGEPPLVSAGSNDGFLARLAPDGHPRWTHPFGSPGSQAGSRMAVNPAGDVVLTGSSDDPIDLGGGPLPNDGTRKHFVAMFDTRGQHLWSRSLDASSARHCCWVSFDRSGHVILARVEAEPGSQTHPPTHPGMPSSLVVTRLAPDGRVLWSRGVGRFETAPDVAGLAVTSDGRIAVVGTLQGSADFGDGPFSGLGGDDIFLLDLTPEGTVLRARRLGDATDQRILGMSTDGWGNLILAGRIMGGLGLGNGPLLLAEEPKLLITRIGLLRRHPTTRAPESQRCTPAPAGRVAWYPFRGPEPDTLGESGPRGRLQKGASLVPGRADHVLLLDGGFFEVPDSAALDFGRGSFSITAWIRTTDTAPVRVILDKRSEAPEKGPVQGYSLFLNRGHLSFQLADGRGHGTCSPHPVSSCANYDSSHFIADGAWHLVTVVVDRGVPRGGTFYIDGVPIVPFEPEYHADSVDNEHPLRIGSRSSSETALYRGLVDDVALWNRALSPTEVADLYRAGSEGMCEAGPDAGAAQPSEPLPRP